MYRVKNFKGYSGEELQVAIKEWVESRNHIQIIDVKIWTNNYSNYSYATIIYQENKYVG